MYCSSLLLFLEFITLSNGYMLWNPNRIEYERFKEAADEAIAQEAKKKYESPLDLSSSTSQIQQQLQLANSQQDTFSNLCSWFPKWTPSSPTIQMPSNLPTTTILPILSTTKSNNFIFRNLWNSKISFPIIQRSTQKAKTIKNTKSRKPTNKGPKKSKNKLYNPLCFFSALPCSPRRKNIYYVPRKNKD